MKRRDFLRSAVAALAATGVAPAEAQATEEEIPRRVLGRTGQRVSIVGLGGAHIGALSDDAAIHLVRTAVDNGVNFLDNSWDYGHGRNETLMGRALRDGYRQKVFLMTKIDGRTAALAQQQLEQSLARLEVDHVDLIQFHEVIRMDDPERVFAAGGGIEYLERARADGKVRFIGFTGHKSPEIHLHMIDTASRHGFTFDTVQMPLNVMDAHFDSFAQKVVPVADRLRMGILGMKPLGCGAIPPTHTATPVECLHYAMNLPITTVIAGCDSMAVLEQTMDAARTFHPLSSQELTAILAKTAAAGQAGRFEAYKTTEIYDGTSRNPQWLG